MVLDDPIRCCEINCTEVGSKEKCPQACKAYDRNELCGNNKSCSIDREFQIGMCPTKCFNDIEPIAVHFCKYPSCVEKFDGIRWNDTRRCPLTCEKEPFPGMITYCYHF